MADRRRTSPSPATAFLAQTSTLLRELAVFVRDAWIAEAEAAPWSARQRQQYIAGLLHRRSIQYPYGGDPLVARVENVAEGAQAVEEGRPGYHLPSVIRWAQSRAARLSRSTGVWYIHVPFRHVSPRSPAAQALLGASRRRRVMTRAVYDVARTLARGEALGRTHDVPGLSSIQVGLRREVGRGGRGRYMTYRTITSASPGWWIPPQPGRHIRDEVERKLTPEIERRLTAMMQEGLAAQMAEVQARLGLERPT